MNNTPRTAPPAVVLANVVTRLRALAEEYGAPVYRGNAYADGILAAAREALDAIPPEDDVMDVAEAADVTADPEDLVGWTLAGAAYHYATGETLHGVYPDPSDLDDRTLSDPEEEPGPDLGRDTDPEATAAAHDARPLGGTVRDAERAARPRR